MKKKHFINLNIPKNYKLKFFIKFLKKFKISQTHGPKMPNVKTFILISRGKIKDRTQCALDQTKLQQCKQFNAWYLWYSHNSLDFPKGWVTSLVYPQQPLQILSSRSQPAPCHSDLCFWWLSHGTSLSKTARSTAASGLFRTSGLATHFQDLGVPHDAFMFYKRLSRGWHSC